jgi:MarC family integral membrane protein.
VVGLVEFLGLVGQLYAIMNPIGKLAIIGPLAVERPVHVRKIVLTTTVAVYVLTALFALAGGFILSIFGVSIDSFELQAASC